MEAAAARISDSEFEIMQVLWEAGRPLTIAEIRASVESRTNWMFSTIKTLLRRLCAKAVVAAEKRDVFYYSPRVGRDEYNAYTMNTLIDRLYAGSAKNLVASLIGKHNLSDDDLRELRALLEEGGHDD